MSTFLNDSTPLLNKLEYVSSLLAQMPTTATSKDLAGALTQLGTTEKTLRQLRIKWMGSLVANAAQRSLDASEEA
ncbi:MAG: hypothetical protein [Microvirus sp.]|nr:MAG: hypothetical protein [Microvirus sp.]